MVPAGDDLILGTADAVFLLRDGALVPWNAALNGKLVGKKINRLAVLQDGTLAVGTITSGLFIFDAEDAALIRIDEASGLGNNTVLALLESQAGNLWLGLDHGLDLVVRSPGVSFITGKNRPPGTVYTAINYRGRAYFGTNQGLYLQKRAPEGFTYELVAGTSGQVWELRELPAGLLCGHNEGTFLIEGATAKKISDRSGGWMTISIDGERAYQELLQATYTGLQLLEWTDGELVTRDIPGFSAPIRHLEWVERRKLLAIHGSRGAFLISLSEDARRILRIDTLSDPILTQTSAAYTGEGVLLQSPRGRRLLWGESLLPRDSFRNVPLGENDYYLQGYGTTAWFVAEPDRVKVYRADEMIAELPLRLRFPYPTIIPWMGDRWLFLLDEGYAEVSIRPEPTPVKPILLHMARRWQEGWRWLSPTDEPSEMAYVNNDLRFAYALPVFDRAVRYRSRLLGYVDDWSEWSETGEREFTNLPEGNYRLEVEANWFGGRATVAFIVLPPWYRSSLAYGFYALAFVALLGVLYHLHLKRLATQARRMEIVRKRELQRERILARNRELKTDVKRKSRELANTTLTLAKKNEMLLALREELAKGRRNPTGSIDHRKVNKLIDRNLNNEEDWSIFESHFNEVHEAFLKRLRKSHPELTAGDLKLAAYLRMDLSSKEIAPLLHISLRGVENKRYRLRKKIGLEGGDDLNRYLLEF
jgi:DNA-binding CsgD family transcriptional regulator